MASDPLDTLRLALMQDVLPVGLAMVERARRGGPRELVEAFSASSDPLAQLRQEGDAAARDLRDSLDRLQPGLGNPVVSVTVRDIVEPPPQTGPSQRELQTTLARISTRLALLEQRLGPPV
jgi:hypothetical protein